MKELKFPKLKEEDIEVRMGGGGNLLLYKNARVDMMMLDNEVGAMNWKREHIVRENIIKGEKVMVTYCIVSIWDGEKNQWVSKEDCGTESNTEAIKGESSDSFKRACFNWGIGRELYTAPKNIKGQYNKDYYVKKIGYDEQGKINVLQIVDGNGVIAHDTDNRPIEVAIDMVNDQTTLEGILSIYNHFKKYQSDERFLSACTAMKNKLGKKNDTKGKKTSK